MTHYIALLDYDGFVCKSYYAAASELGHSYDTFKKADRILEDLTDAVTSKMQWCFDTDDFSLIKIMSGHTWKKDIYSDYKLGRKRNEFLGIYRDIIKSKDDVFVPASLEADDVLVMYSDVCESLENECLIVSDDKDLRYAATGYHSKISESPECEYKYLHNDLYCQMLAGDKEDNIKGIPKVGMKTANKLLDNKYTLKNVIKVYKNHNISKDECLKNLFLVNPISIRYVRSEYLYEYYLSTMYDKKEDDKLVQEIQIDFLNNLQKEVNKIYGGD